MARLAAIEGLTDIALTTNGSLLARQAQALRAAGLGRITVSLDAIDPAVFAAMSGGRGDVADVLAGIDAAQAAGFAPIKLNCVVQRGVNDDQVLPLLDYARGRGHVLRFIEYMDVGTCNGWRREGVVPSARVARPHPRALAACGRWTRTTAAKSPRAMPSPTAGARSVSSVRSASRSAAIAIAPACRRTARCTPACSRAKDATCAPLLAQGERALSEHVAQLWSRRGDRYSELRSEAAPSRRKVEMFLVGG